MSDLPSSSGLQLISCHILESTPKNSSSGQFLLWTWSYPSLSAPHRAMYTKKCRLLLNELRISGNQFFHQGDQWVYLHLLQLPMIDFVAIVLCASDFNPERYSTLCKVLGEKYYSSEFKPSSILQSFLSVQSTGKCLTVENDTFYFHEYDTLDFFRHSKLRMIIQTFGVELILVYTALLLKKRIVVYHHDVSKLYEFILNLPAFVQHRTNIWDGIYPLIDNSDMKLSSFQDSHFHVLGITDTWNQTEVFDLYVNVPAAEVMVAPHARESLTMTKTHKDIALFMVQLCEKQSLTERDIMQEIGKKTQELLESLKMFMTEDSKLSIQELHSREFSPTLESFLISLAQCEDYLGLRRRGATVHPFKTWKGDIFPLNIAWNEEDEGTLGKFTVKH